MRIGEDLSDAESGGVQPQGAAHAVGRRRVEARQDLHGAARSPESGYRLEAGESQDRLGLVAGVPVSALGVLQGRAGLVLAGVSVGGLTQAGRTWGDSARWGAMIVSRQGSRAPKRRTTSSPRRCWGPESMSAAGLTPSARRVCPAGWVPLEEWIAPQSLTGVRPAGWVPYQASPGLGPGIVVGPAPQRLGDHRARPPVIAPASGPEGFQGIP